MKQTIARTAASLATAATLLTPPALAQQAGAPVTLKGIYFCETKADAKRFLSYKARGENSIMAANFANKDAGRQTCAPRMSATVIPGQQTTEFEQGLAFNVQGFTFPEEGNVERFHGTVLGSLSQQAQREQDI